MPKAIQGRKDCNSSHHSSLRKARSGTSELVRSAALSSVGSPACPSSPGGVPIPFKKKGAQSHCPRLPTCSASTRCGGGR